MVWEGSAVVCRAASLSNPAELARSLDAFFELGMPDVRGAKWVQAAGEWMEESLYFENEGNLTGNAWLVKEAEGRVELVLLSGRRVAGPKASADGDGNVASSGESPIQVMPADLEADLRTLATNYKRTKKVEPAEDGDDSSENESEGEPQTRTAGQVLLLLAQLQRAGRSREVAELLPAVFSATKPEEVLDEAVGRLAGARFSDLTEAFCNGGNAGAYAAGIEKLTEQFSRGWRHGDAALLLAQRVRATTFAREQDDPSDFATAVKMVLGLARQDLAELDLHNWLFPKTEEETGSEPKEENAANPAELLPETAAPARKPSPFAAFLATGEKAARAFATLLDDHRLLRLPRRGGEAPFEVQSMGDIPVEFSRNSYDQLPRPYEVSEVAFLILSHVLPESIRNQIVSDGEAARSAVALGWLDSVASLSREQLAWSIVVECNQPSEPRILELLAYLTEHGGEKSQQRLGQLFTDPAVWNLSTVDVMMPVLREYAARLNEEERAGFLAKAKEAARQQLVAYQEHFASDGDEEYKKRQDARLAEQLKQFDDALKPRDMRSRLEEIRSMTEAERNVALQGIQSAANRSAQAELEAAVFLVAAEADDPAVRRDLLTFLTGAMLSGRRQAGATQKTSPLPTDSVTRNAIDLLLKDQATSPGGSPYMGRYQTIGDLAANLLVMPRLNERQRGEYDGLMQSAPRPLMNWLASAAGSLLTNGTIPELPNGAKVSPAQRQQIVDELASKPPKEVITAFLNRSPDEQVAVTDYLKTFEPWPATLREAQKLVTRVEAGPELEIAAGIQRFRGRPIDLEVRREVEQWAYANAREQRSVVTMIRSEGALAGVTLKAELTPRTISRSMVNRYKFPDLDGRPAPEILVFCTAQEVSANTSPAGYALPAWKNEAISKEWREKNIPKDLKPADPAASAAATRGRAFNPEPAERKIAGILSKPKGAFTISFQAGPIQDAAEPTSE